MILKSGKINNTSFSVSEEWTEIIAPKEKLFRFNLNEIWQYRNLILMFVKRDLASQYRQTVLGVLWFLIQPVLTSFIFIILFKNIAGISTDNLPPILFYLSGLIIWNYFSSCLNSTSSTFITNAALFGKVYFPRLVIPVSIVIANLFKFGIQLILVIILMIYFILKNEYKFIVGFHLFFLPAIIFLVGLIGLAGGLIVSALTTKYRDFTMLVSFGVGLLMYISPVGYPLSYLHNSEYINVIRFNPLTPLIEGFRYALFGNAGSFHIHSAIYSICGCLVLMGIGIIFFNKVEKTFIDTV